ncbi:MAG: hypothetical protein ACK5HE_05960 [Bacteroidota bacterium]|jgi:hypothetical protein
MKTLSCKGIAYKLLISFFSVFFLLSEPAKSQTKLQVFSNDDLVILEELLQLLETWDKKEARDFMDKFSDVWSNKVSLDQKQFIRSTCNMMLTKRSKPYPDFTNFLGSVMNFENGNQPRESYFAWQKGVEKLLRAKTMTGFYSYCAMSEGLFKNRAFFKSTTTEWRASSNDYKFEFDSVPRVVFPKTDISCYAKGDSATIMKTSGVYYPIQQLWVGSKGRVDWRRAGIDENLCYADLNNYKISCKTSSYTADSVEYYNKNYFKTSLLGKLTDKVLADAADNRASYPEFNSYDKRLQIPDIYPDVHYDGGFYVKGARIFGSGDKKNPAYLKFYRNKKLFVKVGAKSFIIRTDKISSDQAEVSIYNENDSIYHPGLNMKFIFKEKELTLIRDNQGIARAPFSDSYHQLDMDFEALYWKLDEPVMTIEMIKGSAESNATFESKSYFREKRYYKLQGLDEINPLVKLKHFTEKFQTREGSINEISAFMGISPEYIRPMMLSFNNMGFVDFEYDEDRIVIQERLFDYIKFMGGKKDYDVIGFNSSLAGNQTTAKINLLNFDLKITGVKQIFLSDSQAVNIFPLGQTITVKKNRDFTFAGIINAGRFQFFGKEFSFEYDKFKLNLTNVDSLRIKVATGSYLPNGDPEYIFVKSVIENLNGDLLIDEPSNKSGRKKYPQYPILNSKKNSYVYWDKGFIQKGVYTRSKVGFSLDPFTIDSLDNFTNDALAFNGDFESGGIFPKFRETLKLQEDLSLGFKTTTPEGGYPAYGGKGHYNDKIFMSNQGLRGNGKLDYVTSTTISKDFIFFPDSMNTRCENFSNKATAGTTQFPQASADSAYVHWMPYKDYMNTYNKANHPFNMYDGKSELFGHTALSPAGMTGGGTMRFYKAELDSKFMRFSERVFDADTSDIKISSAAANDIGLQTVNFSSHIDFDNKVGEFKSNGGGAYVKFPVNQYLCYMDQFKWFMEKDNLELSSKTKSTIDSKDAQNEDLDLTGAEFISLHPDQDSLRFLSPRAKYDLKTSIISCHEVRYINVADARLFPDSGEVVIEKKAKIRTLLNAQILANTVTKFHKLFNANIDIYGRKSYYGTADYNYIDEQNTEQKVHFEKVTTDGSGQTIGEGTIPESDNFKLSPYFDYKGQLNLKAANELLSFNGSFKINHNCNKMAIKWIEFKGDVNPREVYIPLDDTTVADKKGRTMTVTGFLLNNDSMHVYSSVVSHRKSIVDGELIATGGYICFDKNTREYKVGSKEKIKELTAAGNYVSLSVDKCESYAEGKIQLGPKLGQVKLQTFGNIKHNLVNDTVHFNMIMALDFFFDNGILKMMSEKFEASTSMQPVPFGRQEYERALIEFIGKKEADKLISQVNLYGAFKKIPDELEHTLFLSDVKMKWNPRTKSFTSFGPIGIGLVQKNQLNKYAKGVIEIVQKKSGDYLNIYLEDDNDNWYLFTYGTGTMMAISSDEKFNTAIKELKPEKRKLEKDKDDKNSAPYQFTIGTLSKKASFLNKMRSEE